MAADERAAKATLDEHYAEWAERLTDAQRLALLDWQTARHRMINELLRTAELHGQERVVERLLETFPESEVEHLLASVGPLQEACSLEVVPEDVVVYRGIDSAGYRKILERLGGVSKIGKGDAIRDGGYLATSIHEGMGRARMGQSPDGLLLVLRVPAGTPAAWLPAATDRDQGELLFAPPTWAIVRDVRPLGKDHRAEADLELK